MSDRLFFVVAQTILLIVVLLAFGSWLPHVNAAVLGPRLYDSVVGDVLLRLVLIIPLAMFLWIACSIIVSFWRD
jgi:hypothetical protein